MIECDTFYAIKLKHYYQKILLKLNLKIFEKIDAKMKPFPTGKSQPDLHRQEICKKKNESREAGGSSSLPGPLWWASLLFWLRLLFGINIIFARNIALYPHVFPFDFVLLNVSSVVLSFWSVAPSGHEDRDEQGFKGLLRTKGKVLQTLLTIYKFQKIPLRSCIS